MASPWSNTSSTRTTSLNSPCGCSPWDIQSVVLRHHTPRLPPYLELAAKNGWNAKVFAYEEGKKARLDCDVSSSVNWDDYGNTHLGQKWQNHGFEARCYRIGFSVHNSLDGSSAYKVNAIAMRLACTNGMVLGKQQTLFSLKHTEV